MKFSAGFRRRSQSVSLALDRLKSLLDSFREEIEHHGQFSFAVSRDGERPTAASNTTMALIRIVDGRGNTVAENLDPARYFTYLGEASEDFSFVKFPYYQPFGYPHGHYRVGPLARLNVARFAGTARADRELREFKQRGATGVRRGVRILPLPPGAADRNAARGGAHRRIDERPRICSPRPIQAHASLNRREGVGSCEAPRGTLFHHYWVDADGLMTKADLLIATGQNNQAMNLSVDQSARHFLGRRPPAAEPTKAF